MWQTVEVKALRGSQWAMLEERHYGPHQVASALHGEAQKRDSMIVRGLVVDDRPAARDPLCRVSSAGLEVAAWVTENSC